MQISNSYVILGENIDKEKEMANIKSAKKRILVNASNAAENKSIKSQISTYTKKFKVAVESKNIEEAKKAYSEVTAVLDSAVKRNVIHSNCAARRKARFAKTLETIAE